MVDRVVNREQLLREQMIYQYVVALDQGDLDGVELVLQTALDDPDLDRVIAEINYAVHEEERLSSSAADAQLVRELLRKHLSSAFVTEEPMSHLLTVGEVAARLQADRRVLPADREVNRQLLGSSVPLPRFLNWSAIKRLADELRVSASEKFWRSFRDVAIMLGMGYSHDQARLAAAREERASYRTRQTDVQQPSPSSEDGDRETLE